MEQQLLSNEQQKVLVDGILKLVKHHLERMEIKISDKP